MRHLLTVISVCVVLLGTSLNLLAKSEEIGIAAISVETNIVGKGKFEVNDTLYEGDEITTSSKGTTTILFNDESMLTLGPDAHARIETYQEGSAEQAGKSVIRVTKGQFRYFPGDILDSGGAQFIAVADKLYGKIISPKSNAPITPANTLNAKDTTIELPQSIKANLGNKQSSLLKNSPALSQNGDAESNTSALSTDTTPNSSEEISDPVFSDNTKQTRPTLQQASIGSLDGAETGSHTSTNNNTRTPLRPKIQKIEKVELDQDALGKLVEVQTVVTQELPTKAETSEAPTKRVDFVLSGLITNNLPIQLNGNALIYTENKKLPEGDSTSNGKSSSDSHNTITFTKIGAITTKTTNNSLITPIAPKQEIIIVGIKNEKQFKLEQISALRTLPPRPRQLTAGIPSGFSPPPPPPPPPRIPPTPGVPGAPPPGPP